MAPFAAPLAATSSSSGSSAEVDAGTAKEPSPGALSAGGVTGDGPATAVVCHRLPSSGMSSLSSPTSEPPDPSELLTVVSLPVGRGWGVVPWAGAAAPPGPVDAGSPVGSTGGPDAGNSARDGSVGRVAPAPPVSSPPTTAEGADTIRALAAGAPGPPPEATPSSLRTGDAAAAGALPTSPAPLPLRPRPPSLPPPLSLRPPPPWGRLPVLWPGAAPLRSGDGWRSAPDGGR